MNKIKLKKSSRIRFLNLFIFGMFSEWFMIRFDVDFFSWDYFIFFMGMLAIVFTDVLYEKIKDREEQKIIDATKKDGS